MPAGICLAVLALSGIARAQTTATPSPTVPAATSPVSSQRIIAKDPDYMKLLTAPLEEDFLTTYSKGFREKTAEIDAKLADITDAKVRAQTRAEEWDKVSRNQQNRFKYEADVALNEARSAFSQKHQDGWLDIGHTAYDENEKSLVVRGSRTSPIDTNFRVAMNAATIGQIYDKFRQIVGSDVERRTHDYVTKSGADSPCARNSDLCYKLKYDEIEKNLRSERMVVVAQGNLEQKKIVRYLLVDYDTETILSEIAPPAPNLTAVAWRFSIGPVPPPVIEPEPVVAPVVAPVQAEATADQHADASAPGKPADTATSVPSAPEPPPARIKIPDSVIAAAIISKVTPIYPAKARAANIHGDVVLHATIDKDGKISGVQVMSGDEMLAPAAIDAVRQWRYKPMLSDGEPMEVDTIITITFSLLE